LKRTITILLLLPLCYTQFGYFGQTILLQWRMKEAARAARIAALPDDAMLRVSLTELYASGRWEEEGKECWYKGHLYDVIRERTVGGATWLYCLDDEREERLIDGSLNATRANLDQPGRQTGHTISISICDLLCETLEWTIEPSPPVQKQYSSSGVRRLSSRYMRVVIPPPKFLLVFFG
jgi:hypothetical protein